MMPAPWIKIFKDMWNNKTRSLLVILSITVGVATVGMIVNASRIIQRDLNEQYAAGNPARVFIYTSPFPKELAKSLQDMREVESADARRVVSASVYNKKGIRKDISLNVIPNFTQMQVNRLTPTGGAVVPGIREILLERQSADLLGYHVGDMITVEMEDKRRFTLRVAGTVHDIYVMPFSLMGEASGYLSMSTLEWMGEKPYYNRLDVVVSNQKSDPAHVLNVADQARDRIIQPAGYQVYRISIPGIGSLPGDHWAHNQINGFILILQIMSVMAILLSSGLVINTISAILVQQIKQIGIMRAMGAVRSQIISMYLINVIVFSVFAMVLAIPLGALGSWWLSNLAAHFVNFDITRVDLPVGIIVLQCALGLVMPLIAALAPILSGTRISVYEAIYQYGMNVKNQRGLMDKLLGKTRTINPSVILSWRNTFRKKGRLAFTLATLTLAGAMFIASFSTYTSLNAQITDMQRYVAFDAQLGISSGANKVAVEREALRVPGVTYAEGWALGQGVIQHTDNSLSQDVELVGLPPSPKTIQPSLVSGRWLDEGSSAQEVVVNQDLLDDEPQVAVGNRIILKVGDHKQAFTVVGILTKHLSGPRVYMGENDFYKLTNHYNQVNVVRVLAKEDGFSTPAVQDSIAAALEKRFDNAGISSEHSITRHAFYGNFSDVFDIILAVLLIMAGLLALVGGIGLTGTLGINILERTREIGVLRAVGAANQAVLRIVVVEGLIVGFISWITGALTSALSSPILAAIVVYTVMKTGMSFHYSFPGLVIWFWVVMLIGVFASLAPARRAALLQVRDVLDYE